MGRRIAVLVGMVLAGGLLVTGAPAGADPSLSVTPSTGLLDFEPVEVTATGLAPNASHLVVQCAPVGCAQGVEGRLPPNAVVVGSDAEGSATVTIPVDRELSAGASNVDCSSTPCWIRVMSTSPIETLVDAPISFAPEGTYQYPEATLAVTYPEPLRAGGPLDLSGAGYHPWYSFSQTQGPVAPTEICRDVEDPDIDEDCTFGLNLTASPEFRFSFVPVDRDDGTAEGRVAAERYLDLPSGEWDCRRQGCTIALSQGRNPVSERVLLEWGPEWAGWPSAAAFVAEVHERIAGPLRSAAVEALALQLEQEDMTGPELLLLAAEADNGYHVEPGPDLRWKNQAVAEVTRQYVALLGRRPDTQGLAYWSARLRAGRPVSWMSAAFGNSSEFRSQYAGLSAAQVVDRAYQRLLGRAGDATGRAYWIGRLQAGTPAHHVVMLMARSAEFRARQADHVRIEAMTFGLLGTAATAEEWASTPLAVAREVLAHAEPRLGG